MRECNDFSEEYFKGLNYLLNEQPDKAIEIFIHMVEADSETVETHFALASLFVKRGEVDRAIRIHQNLIARPTLRREQRNKALYELGTDYMRAGLLDRAENLFLELVNDNNYGKAAMRQLLLIFQQEKEWDQAIEISQRLLAQGDRQMRALIAQYYCELSEKHWRKGNRNDAQKLLKRALSEDKNCVRASLLEAEYNLQDGKAKVALRALFRVQNQDADYLSEIIRPLRQCYEELGQPGEMIGYLESVLERHHAISITLELIDLIRRQQGEQAAIDYMTDYLRQHPSVRGVARLIDMKLNHLDKVSGEDLSIVYEMISQIAEQKPVYQCNNCGFTGKHLHWQCPSCKEWSTVKPIQGVEGE